MGRASPAETRRVSFDQSRRSSSDAPIIKMFSDYGMQPNQSTPVEAKKYIADEAEK
jgi:hypothetical protein